MNERAVVHVDPLFAARLGPHCIVTFMVLEQLRNLVNKTAQPALQ